jgi:hypothetical protein
MISPYLMRLWAVVALSLCLTGCGRSESNRYKLTLAVNTRDGVKRGSSVGEVAHWEVSFPERGVAHKLRGEALYLDLGPGRRPLIALRTSQLRPKSGKPEPWTQDAGPDGWFWLRLYGQVPSFNFWDDVARIARLRGPRKIAPDDLPDLVTFADINDPKTVIEVDARNLQATLGQDITWNEMTLESTEEPITKGIELKLTWLPAFHGKALDGNTLRFFDARKTLANSLSAADFQDPK